MKQKAAALVQSLNQLITSDLDNQAITTILNETITNAFNSVDKAEQKKLYHALSLIVHPDKSRSAEFKKVLNAKGLNSLDVTILNNLWTEIQKNTETPDLPAPSYNPFTYVEKVQQKLTQMLQEIVKEQSINPQINLQHFLEQMLRTDFPELYQYEKYSSIGIQNISYGVALGVNTVISASFIAKALVGILPSFIRSVEIELLSIVSKNRFARREAQLLMMKATLTQNMISVDSLTDDEVRDAFDTLCQNTKATQRSFLESLGQNIDGLSETEQTLLFQKIFVGQTIAKFAQLFPSILNHADVNTLRNKFAGVDINNIPAIISCFEGIPDKTVQIIYNVMRDAQTEQFENAIRTLKHSFVGFQHLSLIAKALYETGMEEASIMERLMQGLIILASLPLIAAGFAWDTFSYLVDATCILLKAASVALINAPLNIQAYFTPAAASQPATSATNAHGLFALPRIRNDVAHAPLQLESINLN